MILYQCKSLSQVKSFILHPWFLTLCSPLCTTPQIQVFADFNINYIKVIDFLQILWRLLQMMAKFQMQVQVNMTLY